MGNDAKRTKWKVLKPIGDTIRIGFGKTVIAHVITSPRGCEANSGVDYAAFIVRACNSYDALLAACQEFIWKLSTLRPSVNFLMGNSIEVADAAIALATEANDGDAPEHLERYGEATMGGDRFPRGYR